MTGGGTFKMLASAQVKEVDFITDRVVVADPGRTPYPSQDGKPEWKDGNANSEIVDGPDEWAVPTWGVQGTKLTVKAAFKATWGTSQDDRTAGKIQIQGYWRGYGASLHFPAKDVTVSTVSADGDTLSYPETESENALPPSVNITGSATIEWQVKIPGTTTWTPAGTSSNEMFVTLAAPLPFTAIYHTAISLSTRASTQATTPEQVVSMTYNVFRDLTIWTALPAYRPPNPAPVNGNPAVTTRKLLNYYKEWNTQVGGTPDLLATSDGKCQAWANFMQFTLWVHGIDSELVGVRPIKPDEGYVIKSWVFGLEGGSPAAGYPYANVRLAGGGKSYVKENDVWQYKWDSTVVPGVTHTTGMDYNGSKGRGQGNTVPAALFTNHALVAIAGSPNKLYDPSYGTGPFDGGTDFNAALLAWEDASVDGFTLNDPVPSVRKPGRVEDVFRRNIDTVLESRKGP